MKLYRYNLPEMIGLTVLLVTLFSCKAVRSGKHDNNNPGTTPIIEPSGDQKSAAVPTPAVPVTQTETQVLLPPATPGIVVTEGLGGRIVNIPEPIPPEPIPALAKPEALQVFALRSIPIGQNGLVARQYRVDLGTRKVGLDELANDQWKQKLEYKMSDEELQTVKRLVSGLKSGTYPTCATCKREVHMILLEGLENNKKALSYAMSDPCTCGGHDERKATVSFVNLRQITEILNK